MTLDKHNHTIEMEIIILNIESLFKEKKVVFSFEVFPPKKNNSIQTIYDTLDALADLTPDFISVTYGAGGNPADRSTCDIAATIKNKHHIEPVAHLTCLNSTFEQINSVLDDLSSNSIENILALRGDHNPNVPESTDFRYASELIKVIKHHGKFSISAACYPECHPEATSPDSDLVHLREKVDAGASHLVSQLFFDNNDFYQFLYKSREMGINVPIEAGIMPVVNRSQIERMISLCGASFPKKFARMLHKYGNDEIALRDAGIAYAVEQIVDLISNSVQGIHLYTMNNPYVARRISENVYSLIRCANS